MACEGCLRVSNDRLQGCYMFLGAAFKFGARITAARGVLGWLWWLAASVCMAQLLLGCVMAVLR